MMNAGDSNCFPNLKNDLIIRSALGKRVEKVPVWIMRQAGRYLPEFRELKQKYDFFQICQTPELACEVTLQPINRFSLDAAIIFSDILVIPQAVGQVVQMKPGVGPVMPSPIVTVADFQNLNWTVNVDEKLSYVYEAIKLTRYKLDGKCPLIGFAGGPWTLMSYMIEGGGSKTMSSAKKWLYTDKEASHKFLSRLTDVIGRFLLGQIRAGAQLVQVFESHAGILSPDQFTEYCLPYLRQISTFLRTEIPKISIDHRVPLIIFAKDAHYALEELCASGYDVIGLDWTIKPQHARRVVGTNVSLQGNMDPCALYGSEQSIVDCVRTMLKRFGCQRYIANLGHGIYPDADPARVESFIKAVHQLSEEMIENDA